MKIKNNTKKELVFYFGNFDEEEPLARVKVKAGEGIKTEDFPCEDLSIQEE